MPGIEPVELSRMAMIDDRIDIATAERVAAGDSRIVIDEKARLRCRQAARRLEAVIAERRHVYGVTTGFGPLANRIVDSRSIMVLQQNLVHHLASGTGAPYPWSEARAIVLCRLMSILQGVSGASDEAIEALVTVLNSDLAPEIPQRGTVGASGDLTPLAHMVLCLQGRGGFFDRGGRRVAGMDGLARLGLAPLDMSRRDGLALVNGTSAMTGVAVCNAVRAQRMIDWSVALTGGMGEAMRGRAEAWDTAFSAVRPHPGQARVTEALRRRIAGSDRIRRDYLANRQLQDSDFGTEDWIGQDAYTLRCAPQVIGAVADSVDWHDRIVTIELNAATDNPLIPEGALAPALHGGNFMGGQIALSADALGQAVTVLAGLMERQVARICDERLNGGLPAFLHQGPAGLNSGLMGAQVTATALLAEIRSIGAASVQSISTNGANQDVVSMGTIAARLARDKLLLSFEIGAVLAIAVAQAMDIVEKRDGPGFSAAALALRTWVRDRSDEITVDRPLGEEIARIARDMAEQPPPPL